MIFSENRFPLFGIMLTRPKKEGARNAGVRLDPRASTPRGTEAGRQFSINRHPVVTFPQVRLVLGAPRAVF
jgi:hypothetical protein